MSGFAIPTTWLSEMKDLRDALAERKHVHEPVLNDSLKLDSDAPSETRSNIDALRSIESPKAEPHFDESAQKPVVSPIRVYEVDVREPVFASVFGLREHRVDKPPQIQPVAVEVVRPAFARLTSDDTEEMERDLSEMSLLSEVVDVDAAHAAGFRFDANAPLDLIKGIGPKTLARLQAAQIKTFADLADCSDREVSNILRTSGPYYRLAKPSSWVKQANLAAMNEWSALRQLQGPVSKRKRGPLSAKPSPA